MLEKTRLSEGLMWNLVSTFLFLSLRNNKKLVARKLQSFLFKLLLRAGLLLSQDLVSFGFFLFRNGSFLGA